MSTTRPARDRRSCISCRRHGDVRGRRRDDRGAARDAPVRRPGGTSGRRPGTRPSSLWAARPARCTRRSTGARRGRSTESRWEAYGEQRYGDALEAVRQCPRAYARSRGAELQRRLLRALAGDTSDETFDHLRRSVELLPRFRKTRAETATSTPCATTRDSSRLFADALDAVELEARRRSVGLAVTGVESAAASHADRWSPWAGNRRHP